MIYVISKKKIKKTKKNEKNQKIQKIHIFFTENTKYSTRNHPKIPKKRYRSMKGETI